MNNTTGSIKGPAHSCRHCQAVVIERPCQQQVDEAQVGAALPFANIDGLTVLSAVSDGCKFFNWAVTKFNKHEERTEDDEISEDWSLHVGVLEGHVREDEFSIPFVNFQWYHENGNILDLDWLAVIAELGDSAARYINMRPTTRSMASGEALTLARGWLSDCQISHDQCNAAAHRTMPSRVVEISWMSGSQEPSLRILQNQPWDRYAALSYCWGRDQPIKTTTSTIQQFVKAISFSELPKSIRDGILTAWRLSLRLLWVDSLCIIQDDSHSTQKEIASMPQIYQNAHVTISAARSSDSQDGFLHELSVPSALAEVFKLPFRCPGGSGGSVILFHEPDYWDPIERRAWPLQEFLLSRRILKYGSYQLSWSCLSAEFHENENAGLNWFSNRDKIFSNLRRQFHDSQKDIRLKSNIWRCLVREYTGRNLTKSNDRLLAISGIATAVGTGQNDVYLGGLWHGDLPLGLLWEVISPLQPRPREYRAPSWSWASVDGTVECFADAGIDPDLNLLSYEVTPTQPTARYGALKAGHIEIQGHMRNAYWIDDRQTLVDVETGDAADGEALARTRGDSDEGVSTAPILVWCLQICPYDPILGKGPHGLLLATEDESVFRRVGIFSFDPALYEDEKPQFYDFHREKQQKWAEGCQLRKIVIR